MQCIHKNNIWYIVPKKIISLDAFRKFAKSRCWLYHACQFFCTEELGFHSADFCKVLLAIFTKFQPEKLFVEKTKSIRHFKQIPKHFYDNVSVYSP